MKRTPYAVRSGSLDFAYIEARTPDEAVALVLGERPHLKLGPSIEVLPRHGAPILMDTDEALHRLGIERWIA